MPETIPAVRKVSEPSSSSYPRSALDSLSHRLIDTLLKDLRMCSRQLTADITSMRNELQILERLFYKGRNQHRTALHWRKVVEMRRFGQRIMELELPSLVESLRYSFFSESAEHNPKLLKGSWSHVPNSSLVVFILERMQHFCTLIDKARTRFVGVHLSFTLAMQTGAFLQLTLTLIAILSRLDALMKKIRGALQVCHSVLMRLFNIINPESAAKDIRANSIQYIKSGNSSSVTHSKVKVERPEEFPDEDLGSTIIRRFARATESVQSNVSSDTVATATAPCIIRHVVLVDDIHKSTSELHSPEDSAFDRAAVDSSVSSSAMALQAFQSGGSRPDLPTTPPAKKRTEHVRVGSTKMARSMKRNSKRKRNEIDDIFGML